MSLRRKLGLSLGRKLGPSLGRKLGPLLGNDICTKFSPLLPTTGIGSVDVDEDDKKDDAAVGKLLVEGALLVEGMGDGA
eukprot:CAMPEP_0168225528 /NCGR_PEP_ID=MMETSP0140_2-20121125/12797_1 /TAXON_ID=44445 /ORGANISM="Pseudo-nitzschia australis, Strain 10249 10 AB" /LENGTH=78 /DNA_ID=CAMNT_0008156293 /DNA_START=513 /DNA_END=749 /DNA_ORIENTATION=-